MMVPTLHLNGTSRVELLNQQLEALQALRLALLTMRAAAPNGRDYYPQGPGALAKAQTEHELRLSHVQEALAGLEALAMAISNGGHVQQP
jgi:hypothetical protein